MLGLLAVSKLRVTRATHPFKWVGLGLYGAQCVLNVGWSLLFFALRRPDAALIGLVVLDLVLAVRIIACWRVARKAGLLLVPYLFWLLFATAINGFIDVAN